MPNNSSRYSCRSSCISWGILFSVLTVSIPVAASPSPKSGNRSRSESHSPASAAVDACAAGKVPQDVALTPGLKGQIVDSTTSQPIAGAEISVAVEQPDGPGNDIVFLQVKTDPSGNFEFCSLPAGTTFDIVAVVTKSSGPDYAATIVMNVPPGATVGKIPVSTSPAPVTFHGFVTATTGQAAAKTTATIGALQTITIGNSARPVTIMAASGSTIAAGLNAASGCPQGAPANSNCATYTLVEPSVNPSVGTFANGMISYAAPATSDVLYTLRATAANPDTGLGNCIPSIITTNLDAMGKPLKASPGATVSPARLDFSGCF